MFHRVPQGISGNDLKGTSVWVNGEILILKRAPASPPPVKPGISEVSRVGEAFLKQNVKALQMQSDMAVRYRLPSHLEARFCPLPPKVPTRIANLTAMLQKNAL